MCHTLAVDAGHEVVLSDSRGPEALADPMTGLGEHARAGAGIAPGWPDC